MTGRCIVCGWEGRFLRVSGGREGAVCGNCGSTGRSRAVSLVLARVLGEHGPVFAWRSRPSLRVLESSPRGALAMFLGEKFDYYATEFDPAKIAAGTSPRAYADFQQLHYDAETFDVVIASDVFEHIRRDADAMREVHRVLKHGGYLILTVPYDHQRAHTLQRVDTSGPVDVHVLPPQYHGGGGQTLAYREYGRDLVESMRAPGFVVTREEIARPDFGVTPQSVFVARKGRDVELAAYDASSDASTGPMLLFRLFVAYKCGGGDLWRSSSRPNPRYFFKGLRTLWRDFRHARRR